MTSYIGVAVYLFNIVFWKFYKSTKAVKLSEMDLTTGRLEANGEREHGFLISATMKILRKD